MNQPAFKAFENARPAAVPASVVVPFIQAAGPDGITGEVVREICELRRKREQSFPGKLFGDATWDILLQLYAAQLDAQRLSITRLTRISGIPATTVLRRLSVLESEGLLTRADDPFDARRVYVALTAAGMQAMDRCFAASAPNAMCF